MELDEAQVEQFFVYMEELKKWNEKINLTSIETRGRSLYVTFLIHLRYAAFLKGGERVLDMGSGAGFPGLALKDRQPGTRRSLYG